MSNPHRSIDYEEGQMEAKTYVKSLALLIKNLKLVFFVEIFLISTLISQLQKYYDVLKPYLAIVS